MRDKRVDGSFGPGSGTMPVRTIALALAGASLAAACFVASRPNEDLANWVWKVVVLALGCGLLVLAAAALWEKATLRRRGIAVIFVVAVVCRIALLGSTQQLSDDAARYHWDGKVLAHGVNPYLHSPDDPRVSGLRTHELDRAINHPDLNTVYPPLAECLFAIAYLLSPGSLGGFHILTLLAEALTWLLLVVTLDRRELPRSRVLLLAWSPLIIFEGYLPGHVDLLGLPLVALFAFGVETGRPVRAGVFLGLATLIKPLPLLFLPAAMRELGHRKSVPLIAATLLTIGIFYVPFLSAGHRLFDSMLVMATSWRFNGSLAAILETALPTGVTHPVVATMLAALVLTATWRGHGFLNRCLLSFAAFVVCTTTLYPWYLVWVMPLLVLRRDPALLAIGLLAPLANLVWVESQASGVWSPPAWARLAQYIPFYALLMIGAVRGRGMFGGASEP